MQQYVAKVCRMFMFADGLSLSRYETQHEDFTAPVDGHDTTGQYIPSLHYTTGVTKISLPGFNSSIDTRVMQTTGQLAEFPYNEDMSGGSHSLLGVGFVQSAVGGGSRSSSSTSYLAQANSRPGLTVLINATVLKLVKTGTSAKGIQFKSVQFASGPGSCLSHHARFERRLIRSPMM
jgi:choline dehydrogenase-like flavoprotein